MKRSLNILMTVLVVIIATTCFLPTDALPSTNTAPKRRNVYVFSSGFGDMGAFRRFFSDQPGRDPIIAGQPISPSPAYFGPPVSAPRVDIYGPLDRFSDGRNWVDFFCEEFGLHLYDGYALETLPSGKQNVINFAIGGATMNGNTYNSLTPNSDYGMIAGQYSYVYQVNEFLGLLSLAPPGHITEDDIFIIGEVGGNDIPAILTGNYYDADINAYIENFIGDTLWMLQALYNAGARKVLMSYADSSVWSLQPAAWKTDPSGEIISILESLTDDVVDALLGAINDDIAYYMTGLDLNLIPIGEAVSNWLIFIDDHGVRRPIASDVGDPRGGFPALPFPTYYDMLQIRGVKVPDTFFYSDTHPTEHTYEDYSEIYSEHIESYFK